MRSSLAGAIVILCGSVLVAQTAPEISKAAKPGKVYHIGGDIKPPRVILSPQPVIDNNKKKIAEESANKVVQSDSTLLSIVVAEDGSVQSVKVSRSLNRNLDAKAIDAVKKWKFEPATKKGIPVAVELMVEVDFHLYQ